MSNIVFNSILRMYDAATDAVVGFFKRSQLETGTHTRVPTYLPDDQVQISYQNLDSEVQKRLQETERTAFSGLEGQVAATLFNKMAKPFCDDKSYGPEDETVLMTTLGNQVELIITQHSNAHWTHVEPSDFQNFAHYTVPHVVNRAWERGDVVKAVKTNEYGQAAKKVGGIVMQASDRVMRTADLERIQGSKPTAEDYTQTGIHIYHEGLDSVVGTEVAMRALNQEDLAKAAKRMQTPDSSDIVVSGEDSPLNMVSTKHKS
ncbi:hypothetical protein HOI26_01175 [Candidatus Woesearchaeota archaeon]|nr:hypothetical protein [Candidatus Woesearchaeota archaeon]